VENNLVRVALQALAAVLGGCQSLHTNSFDEALGLPGELSARLALHTQLILAHESGVALCADPLGGSYAIEALTDHLEARAREILAEIDALGGGLEAVATGYYQRRIAEAAFRYQREVESGTRKVVGVNAFTGGVVDGSGGSIQRLDDKLERGALAGLDALRAKRDPEKAKSALHTLRIAAKQGGRMEAILNAARARCTVGEICGIWREVFGEYQPRN
jgi:methylmalonyl-CoA mutase N-terminal domain/subunit